MERRVSFKRLKLVLNLKSLEEKSSMNGNSFCPSSKGFQLIVTLNGST